MSASAPCRFTGWFIAFVVTIGVFQLVAGLHPRSIPWIVTSLLVAAAVGAALLSLVERLCTRMSGRG